MDTVPVAAADHVAPLCRGPVRSGAVSAVFSGALILDCPADHREPARTIALLTRRATAVPVGVLTLAQLPAVAAGTPVQVGAGGITLPGTTFRVVRTWSSAVPPIHPDPDRLVELADRLSTAELGLDRRRLAVLAHVLADVLAEPQRKDDTDDTAIARTVGDLVGRGAGSTPAGDDVLAGAMVGLRARGRPDLAGRLAETVDPTRTTPYSAALLEAAAAGHAALEALAVLRWLHRCAAPTTINVSGPKVHVPSRSDPRTMVMDGGGPVGRLLAVGHTSGADLAAGLLLCLRAAAAVVADGAEAA